MNVHLEFSSCLLLYCAFDIDFMPERYSTGGLESITPFFFFFLLFSSNLLYERGFTIVISQLQRALRSELLFSAGSPSYSVSRCAQETGFLQGISPGGQTYFLVSWPNIPLGLSGPVEPA